MQIDKNLYNEINDYCKLNKLKTKDFIHTIIRNGFFKEKYGDTPFLKHSNVEQQIDKNDNNNICDNDDNNNICDNKDYVEKQIENKDIEDITPNDYDNTFIELNSNNDTQINTVKVKRKRILK